MGYVARQMLYGLADRGGYANKVLRTNPIAYWPLWEASGTVAKCLVNRAQNGTYNSDVSGWPVAAGIGDGNTAPRFDGANDAVNVYSVPFVTAFDGDEGSIALWAQVANAGVWTDGTLRYCMRIHVNFSNYVYLGRDTVNNQLEALRRAAGGASRGQRPVETTTDWFHYAFTWSSADNEISTYVDGVRTGPAVWGDIWAGVPVNDRVNIGSFSAAVPANVWDGGVAHVAVWDRPLLPAEVVILATL